MSGKFIITRHGESEWNARGVWTGTTDVHLTEKGRHEAELMGNLLVDEHFDHAFVSQQVRTHETLEWLLMAVGQPKVPITINGALNERDYGSLTGKNKWEVKAELGEEAFNGIRRGWDFPVPQGETLKEVYERAVPYFKTHMLPLIESGQTVLLCAHGNSIRALVKYIESVSNQNIAAVEMIFGTALIYRLDENGKMVAKQVLAIETEIPPA